MDDHSDRGHVGQAAMLNSEIQAVMAMMRQNSTWAVVPTYYDEETTDDPLLEDFKALRRRVFGWKDFKSLDPNVYLSPFLAVVRSVKTSGPITGIALSALYKFLTYEIFDVNTVWAAEAMHNIADAVTHCRFEATDHASDEVVLSKILEVLLACLRCDCGSLLTDDDVCSIVQAAFRIGQPAGPSSQASELLQRTARHTLLEIVRIIFRQLPSLPEDTPVPPASPPQVTPPSTPPYAVSAAPAPAPALTLAPAADGAGPAEGEPAPAPAPVPERRGVSFREAGPVEAALPHEPLVPYGLPCILEVLRFLVSLVALDETPNSEEMCGYGLQLVNSALEMGQGGFVRQPSLLMLLQDDLFAAMLHVCSLSTNLSIISFVCSIVLNLYLYAREHIKLQLEAFVECVLLRFAEGKNAPYDAQRVATEALVDLCRQPTFMVDMYANFDCAIEPPNMFEKLCNLLSKNAFPVNSPLSAVHLLSLEGLLAVVHSIADRCAGGGDPPQAEELVDPEEYTNFWDEKCETPGDLSAWAAYLRRRKFYKRRLTVAADHFNRNVKKGLEFMRQIHLLPGTGPTDMTAESVAKFLRYTPGLDKGLIGEYLGEYKPFNMEVLKEYTATFNFKGMNLEMALRTYLESFMVPGEAQKIERMTDHFAGQFMQQCGEGSGVENQDAASVLAYSVLMLNTDQHNKQVKGRMDQAAFIKNVRGINNKKDFPREMLETIFNSIHQNEIKLKGGGGDGGEMTGSRWVQLIKRTMQGERLVCCGSNQPAFDREMFSIIWGPTIAAISVVFDHAEDDEVLRQAIDGFIAVAKIAARHRLEDVMDNLVVSLCKFTTLLNPTAARPSVSFGDDDKARMAAVTAFSIANKYGDHVRLGWRNILDCILRLHKLELLPDKVTSSEDDPDAKAKKALALPKGPLPKRTRSGTMLSSLFGFSDAEGEAKPPTEAEVEAIQRTMRTIESCRIDEIFSDSKFLEAESLQELAKALIWASGQGAAGTHSATTDDETDTGVFCLDLLTNITLRNRDRILLLWPPVHEHLAKIIEGAREPTGIVEKAVGDLLRVCQRLVPYKEDIADRLLQSLQLILKLDAKVAEALMMKITGELELLVRTSAAHIKSAPSWRTVCSMLRATAVHPDASEKGFEALLIVMRDSAHVTPTNFLPCVDAALAFVEGRAGGSERSLRALDLLSGLTTSLGQWAGEGAGAGAEDLVVLWQRLVRALAEMCLDARAPVRGQAVALLQRVLLAAEAFELQPIMWRAVFLEVIFPTLRELQELGKRKKEYPEVDRTLRMAINLLAKTFLQYMPRMKDADGFLELWAQVLDTMAGCVKAVKSEELSEAVPEALKNILLVMAAQGMLKKEGGGGGSLWEVTVGRAKIIAPSINVEALVAA